MLFPSTLLTYIPYILPLLFILHFLHNKYQKGLNRYPGPPLAGYTNLWRFFDVWNQHAEKTHIELHKKYGDIVRLGPKVLSFADPRAVKVIYGLGKGMVKSDFYPIQQAVAKGTRLPSLFSTLDENFHAKYRRCINAAFSMSSLVGYEPLVDETMDVFIDRTRVRFCQSPSEGHPGEGQTCKFSEWLQFFAFDVIGQLTWSRRLGFIEENRDIDDIITFVCDFLKYSAPVGQMPWLDLIWEKNPLRLWGQRKRLEWGWGGTEEMFAVTRFAVERAREREGLEKRGEGHEGAEERGVDLLTKFQQAQREHPEFMTDRQVLSSCTSMIFAGSETTSISLSSIFYHLARHPQTYTTLMAELDTASRNGTITPKPNNKVTWSEAQKLPYLDAVIQESFRLHPAPGLLLERVVPPQGIEILGEVIPGGTIVGCNAWVLHRRPEIFGEDVETFRPERWLEASPSQLKEMRGTMFQFGAGARTCIGKNISLLEIYKLVPTFLRNFEVELVHPEKEWETCNAWFVTQDFETRFRPRAATKEP